MEKTIVANHKTNLSLTDINSYIEKLSNASFKPIICPTAIYAPYFIQKGIKTGLQNICFDSDGAYTGEISAQQAKSIGVEYVMIGHSERRRIFKETDEEINQKVKRAIENNLKVILCVGDDIGDDYQEVIYNQITKELNEIDEEVIISYEPVYSIGTDIIPSIDELNKIIKYIKSLFSYDVKVFYGGSVNMRTALDLKKAKGLSGYLIGSASLDVDEFINLGEVLL